MGTSPDSNFKSTAELISTRLKCLWFSRMLNRLLKGFLPWFRHVQQGRYIRLLVWWLLRRGINLRCYPSMMQATVVSLFSASEPLISSLEVWDKVQYTFSRWRRSQITCSSTWATQLTWMFSICFTCRLFDSMLEVIVAAMYSNLMSVYSGCLDFCNGSCASLCIIDISRDWILKNILAINATVHKSVEMITI